ncbi:hypothetical protein N7509_013572 [Penicillium cosmopolitanum]|uniref:Apple domain-containing protein n=1 Tax=Penicillium cosmopolitanum TaxID=1131564 RepID=A0A9W9SDL4_9EURO|nr:uncharacterized protein N7509_013572 [Penicillium cosmopolitanum]KAJ5376686.1 hypothetical protein N7509_013572 [Penicillium cosmopolitanum]
MPGFLSGQDWSHSPGYNCHNSGNQFQQFSSYPYSSAPFHHDLEYQHNACCPGNAGTSAWSEHRFGMPLWPANPTGKSPWTWQCDRDLFGQYPDYGFSSRPGHSTVWNDYGACNDKVHKAVAICRAEETESCKKQMANLEQKLREHCTKAIENTCKNNFSRPQSGDDCKENCKKEKASLEDRLQAQCATAQLNAATKCKSDQDTMTEGYRKSNKLLEEENERLRKQNDELAQKAKDDQKTKEAFQQENDRLKNQEDENAQKLKDNQKAKEKLEQANEALEQENKRLKKQNNEYVQKAKDDQKAKENSERDNEELEQENKKLKKQNDEHAQKAKDDQRTKDELEQENKNLKKQNNEQTQKAKDEQKAKEDLEKENDRLKKQEWKDSQKAKDDQKAMEDLREENDRLKKQEEKNSQKTKDDQKAIEELKKENDRLQKQEDKDPQKTKDDQKAMEDLRGENDRLKKQEEKNSQKAKDDQKAMEELKKENDKLKAESGPGQQLNKTASQPNSSNSELAAFSGKRCPSLHGEKATVFGVTYEAFCGARPRGRYTDNYIKPKNLGDCMAACAVDRSCQGIYYETSLARCRITMDWDNPPRMWADSSEFSLVPVAPREGGIGTTTPDIPSILIKDEYRNFAGCPDTDGMVVSVGSLQFRVHCRKYQPKKHIEELGSSLELSGMLAICALNPGCQGIANYASTRYMIAEHEKLPERTGNSDLVKEYDWVVMLTEPRVAT